MRTNRNAFDFVNVLFFLVLCVLMAYPFWHAFVGSLMEEGEYIQRQFFLFPLRPTLSGYRRIFEYGRVFSHLQITLMITVLGTTTALLCTAMGAFGLSKNFFGSTAMMYVVVIAMFFDAGLIARYLNIRALGLLNSTAVYIVPRLAMPYYFILLRTSFREFPMEIEESARMDGCKEIRLFFQIVVPLSKPILAAIGLFFAVLFWNTYLESVFFMTDPARKTVQEYLRSLVMEMSDMEGLIGIAEASDERFSAETLRLANVVIVLAPILMVYPFLQKYFVKGLMLGSVKG